MKLYIQRSKTTPQKSPQEYAIRVKSDSDAMGRKYSVGYDKLAVEHQHKQQVLLLQCHIFSTRKITHIYIFKKRVDLVLEMLCLCVTLQARDDYIIFCSYNNSGRYCNVALTLAAKTLGRKMNRACSCVITRMKKKAAQIIKKKPIIVYQWVGCFIKGAKIPRGLNYRSVLSHLQSDEKHSVSLFSSLSL